MASSELANVDSYSGKNAGFKLLKVCNSKHATNFLSGYCSLSAAVVAATFDGAWAKSLYNNEFVLFATNSSLFAAPLNVDIVL